MSSYQNAHPQVDDWEVELCEKITANKEAGKKESKIIIAEGAKDKHGKPIRSFDVEAVLKIPHQ